MTAHQPPANDIIKPLYIPRRWYKLLQRLASLEPGRYLLTVDVHEGEREPCHTVLPLGKVENQR
jgi:hypothetical protein